MKLDGLTVLVTGGTGSLGNAVIRRLMTGEMGKPRKVLVFSRDELKQHEMRVEWHQTRQPIADLRDFSPRDVLEFKVGDIRLYDTLMPVLRRADVVINAAALKQVPACEYFPFEAVRTNIEGAYNIVRGIREHRLPVQKVVAVSTDKACKPVNVMGMTKAIQERVILEANLECPDTHFLAVRYGNVLASRGSVVPHFHDQAKAGGPLTITSPEMTRFLLTLNQAVDTIFAVLNHGRPGETFIPQVPSAKVTDIAKAIIGSRKIQTKVIGIRPGEKVHEILVSEEECLRTGERKGYYVIHGVLPEFAHSQEAAALKEEYSSAGHTMSEADVRSLMVREGFAL